MATADETERQPATAERKLAAGDRVALDAPGGERLRTGEITELVLAGGKLQAYRIRWDDGHQALFAPSGRGLDRLDR